MNCITVNPAHSLLKYKEEKSTFREHETLQRIEKFFKCDKFKTGNSRNFGEKKIAKPNAIAEILRTSRTLG